MTGRNKLLNILLCAKHCNNFSCRITDRQHCCNMRAAAGFHGMTDYSFTVFKYTPSRRIIIGFFVNFKKSKREWRMLSAFFYRIINIGYAGVIRRFYSRNINEIQIKLFYKILKDIIYFFILRIGCLCFKICFKRVGIKTFYNSCRYGTDIFIILSAELP